MLRYFWSGSTLSFFFWLGATLVLAAVIARYAHSDYRTVRAELVVESDRPVNFDIYYDIGRGYNEVDHQSMRVETVNEPVTLGFCIPVRNRLEKLRFDPAKEQVRMVIHSLTLSDGRTEPVNVSLHDLVPRQQITVHDVAGGTLVLETALDGDDPIVELPSVGRMAAGAAGPGLPAYLSWMVASALCFLAGGFMFRYFLLGL